MGSCDRCVIITNVCRRHQLFCGVRDATKPTDVANLYLDSSLFGGCRQDFAEDYFPGCPLSDILQAANDRIRPVGLGPALGTTCLFCLI